MTTNDLRALLDRVEALDRTDEVGRSTDPTREWTAFARTALPELAAHLRRAMAAMQDVELKARIVIADGQQFVRGTSLSVAPLGDTWDKRWRADLDALDAALAAFRTFDDAVGRKP